MEVTEKLSAIEERLKRLEKALQMLVEVVTPLAEAHAAGKAAAKQKKRWFRREPIAKGRWLNLFAVGFKRPET